MSAPCSPSIVDEDSICHNPYHNSMPCMYTEYTMMTTMLVLDVPSVALIFHFYHKIQCTTAVYYFESDYSSKDSGIVDIL